MAFVRTTRKPSVKLKLWLSMGFLIFLMIMVGATNLFSTNKIKTQARLIHQSAYPLAISTTDLQLWMERFFATINTAASASREDLLEPLDEIERHLEINFENLGQLVRDLPELSQRLNNIITLYDSSWKVGHEWVEATLHEKWDLEPVLAKRFYQLEDELYSNLTDIRNSGIRRFSQSMSSIYSLTVNVWTQTLGIFLVGVVVFIALTFYLYRSINVPMTNLLSVIKDIRKPKTDLSKRVNIKSQDEFGQVGSAFNEMLDDLEDYQEQLTEYSVKLENKVEMRTIELQNEKEALSQSEGHLKAIWNSTPSGIMVIEADSHKIVDINPFALKLLGKSKKEVIGKVCHSFICPAEIGKCPITDLGQQVENSERTMTHKSGNTIYILKTVIPFYKKGREYLIESFVDINERKRVQDNLIIAKEAAEKANCAKSDFLANMSHELRTPLNHIIGFTEVVVDGHFGELNRQQKEYLEDSLTSSRHLLSLINDILDLSKVEAGKLELERSSVDLRMLLENSLIMVKEKALKNGISLSSKINGIPKTIEADERKLKQIQYNLLFNAVKFTPKGGHVDVNARIWNLGEDSDLEYPGFNSQHPNWIHISVADTGIGLSKEDLGRIFNPFEQVENSISRKYQGTGLGLSLTKTLVDLHGGKIWAESEGEGKGSKFHYIIPHQRFRSLPIRTLS